MRSVGLSPTEAELKDMIKTVDADKNGTLTFTEFVKLMIREVNKSKLKEIKDFFSTFDKNNDGRVTADEVREVFLKGGFPEAEVKRITANMLGGADFNKDQIIDIEGKSYTFIAVADPGGTGPGPSPSLSNFTQDECC